MLARASVSIVFSFWSKICWDYKFLWGRTDLTIRNIPYTSIYHERLYYLSNEYIKTIIKNLVRPRGRQGLVGTGKVGPLARLIVPWSIMLTLRHCLCAGPDILLNDGSGLVKGTGRFVNIKLVALSLVHTRVFLCTFSLFHGVSATHF